MRTSQILCLAAAVLVPACSDEARPEAAEAPPPGGGAGGDDGVSTPDVRTFQRELVLLGGSGDSLLAIPWLFSTRTGPGGVARSARVLVLRETEWEPVFRDDWEDPPTAAPWRVVPRGGLHLLVGADDALERVVYEEEARHLELIPGGTLMEWRGPRGGSYHLMEGAARVGGRAVEGYMLDVSRSTGPGEPAHGGWAFLVSGDSLQVALHDPRPGASGPETWRGWARLDFRGLRWPAVSVEWTEVRAFEEARRDVPVAWRIASPGDEVTGELETTGVHVEAGEGPGPQLPVSGLFGVRGTLTVEARDFPVSGLLRHVQR